jgi:hypothetical protein
MEFIFADFELTCDSHVQFEYVNIVRQNLNDISITLSRMSASKINQIVQRLKID